MAALLYAFAVRRLLGLRLAGLRTLIAGVLAFLVASPIITALVGNNTTRSSPSVPDVSSVRPVVTFVRRRGSDANTILTHVG